RDGLSPVLRAVRLFCASARKAPAPQQKAATGRVIPPGVKLGKISPPSRRLHASAPRFEKCQRLARERFDPCGVKKRRLLLAEHEIDDPAPADVRTRSAAMVEDGRVVAPGVLECVSEDRYRAEVARLVHPMSQRNRGVRAPLRGKLDRPERVA